MTHLDIMKVCYENERKRVIAKAICLARELENSAKIIAKAAEEGDLNRIAWLTRTHDVELSTRSTVLHENLHMIAGFDTHTVHAQPTSLAESLKAKADGACHQDVNASSAQCAVHGTTPDWSSELPNYKGPTGWICPEGGLFKQDFRNKP